MAFLYIDRDECIGDSLAKINDNAYNFDQRIITNTSNLSSLTTVVQNVSAANVVFWEQQAQGVPAGAATPNAWNIRTLNNYTAYPASVASTPTSNRFTLPAGTWLIRASAPAFCVNNHMIRLVNYNGGSPIVVATGSSEYSASTTQQQQQFFFPFRTYIRTTPVTTRSVLDHIVTRTSPTTYYIEHFIQSIDPQNSLVSLGTPTNAAVEKYTFVTCSKIG